LAGARLVPAFFAAPVFLGALFVDLGLLFTRPAFAFCTDRLFFDARVGFVRVVFVFAIRAR
jgi:hypothetical protein